MFRRVSVNIQINHGYNSLLVALHHGPAVPNFVRFFKPAAFEQAFEIACHHALPRHGVFNAREAPLTLLQR
jgi:hypothetical protein